MKEKVSARRDKRRQKNIKHCHCCHGEFMFCWQCRCGFAICQSCMHENLWGMTCNGVTWKCPDCGVQNGYGNN